MAYLNGVVVDLKMDIKLVTGGRGLENRRFKVKIYRVTTGLVTFFRLLFTHLIIYTGE